jgi:hypothetical protein
MIERRRIMFSVRTGRICQECGPGEALDAQLVVLAKLFDSLAHFLLATRDDLVHFPLPPFFLLSHKRSVLLLLPAHCRLLHPRIAHKSRRIGDNWVYDPTAYLFCELYSLLLQLSSELCVLVFSLMDNLSELHN